MSSREKRFAESHEYWEKRADIFSNIYLTKKWLLLPMKRFLKQRMSSIVKYIKADKDVVTLDMGCGSGEFTNLLADYYGTVIGVDSSQMMIDLARKNSKNKNITYYKTDCSGVPLDSGSVDYIFVLGLLDYTYDLDIVFREFVRLIKRDGEIVFTIPKTPSLFEPLRWSSAVRQKLFKIPPIVNVMSKDELSLLLKKYGMETLDLISLWTTMWIVHAKVVK